MNRDDLTLEDLDQAAELLLAEPERAERCDGCRHWSRLTPIDLHDDEPVEADDDGRIMLGECRRFPPRISDAALAGHVEVSGRRIPLRMTAVAEASVFPVTLGCHWCGEHSAPAPVAPATPRRTRKSKTKNDVQVAG